MKNLLNLFTILILITCSSCNYIKYNDLYKETDDIIESLQTKYESYGVLGIDKYSRTTDDGLYNIAPIGRLIIVRINKSVSTDKYEDLKNALKDHYEDNIYVNKVYLNSGGTVTIDCRN